MAFITVFIPVRNGQNYIGECIASVLRQRYGGFNVRVLDNCSEDKTVEIVKSFADSRIAVIPSDKPLGIVDNWTRILRLDAEEYMTILSHDDVLYPGFLEDMVELVDCEPGASLYHAHFDIIDAKGRVLHRCKPIPPRETGDEFLLRAHNGKEDLVGTGYVMRTSDFRRVGGFPRIHNLLFADSLCWYSLAKLSYKACTPTPLYGFRTHLESLGRNSTLWDFHEGARQYLAALSTTPHFLGAGNERNARRFIHRFCGYRHRLILFDLIDTPDAARLRTYRQNLRELKALAPKDRLFPLGGVQLWLWYCLACLPFPWIARSVLQLRRKMALAKRLILGILRGAG
jgi:glycosyltransferase involved in cell wall biosynthesis